MELLLYILTALNGILWFVCADLELGIIQKETFYGEPKILTLDKCGMKSCARRCLYHKSCFAFNYYTKTLVCDLLNNDGTSSHSSLSETIASDISTWKLLNDVCYPNPCQENEECTQTENEYFCRKDASACDSQPCNHNGTCKALSDLPGYSCSCTKGYHGRDCEHTPCYSIPCKNSGTCTVNGESFNCTCTNAYFGTICTESICDTKTRPCGMYGYCEPLSRTSYRCVCNVGFYGDICQYSPCSSTPCHNKGTCTVTSYLYNCSCPSPFFGSNCQYVNCTTATCKYGTCHNGHDVCVCNPGYTGIMCDMVRVVGRYLVIYRNDAYLTQGPYDVGYGNIAVVRITALGTQSKKDLLQIFDGQNVKAPLLATRSGTNVGCDVIASGRYVLILWTTDGSVNTGSGWTFYIYRKITI